MGRQISSRKPKLKRLLSRIQTRRRKQAWIGDDHLQVRHKAGKGSRRNWAQVGCEGLYAVGFAFSLSLDVSSPLPMRSVHKVHRGMSPLTLYAGSHPLGSRQGYVSYIILDVLRLFLHESTLLRPPCLTKRYIAGRKSALHVDTIYSSDTWDHPNSIRFGWQIPHAGISWICGCGLLQYVAWWSIFSSSWIGRCHC